LEDLAMTDAALAPPLDPAADADRGAQALAPRAAGHPRRWLIFALALVVECMDLLDATIVNVAAPSIHDELHTSSTALQWIVGGYSLALAVGLVIGARLGDIHGRRRLFIAGAAGFTLCSTLCGIAPSTGWPIAFRLAQGAAAALMIPQGLGLIRDAFPEEERAKAFGLFGPVIGLSAVLGPIIGGALVSADLFDTGWRLVFLVNLPLGLLAVLGSARVLPASERDRDARLDWRGGLLVAAAMGLIVYPLVQGRELGWPAWTFALMAAGLALLAAFARHALRLERTGAGPLVTPSIFRTREYSAGVLVILVFFGGISGVMLVLGLYLQLGLGFSAIHAGLTFVPWSLGMAVGAGLGAGMLAPRFGRHVLHAGMVVMVAGVIGTIAVVHGGGMGVTSLWLAGPLLVTGIGMGLVVAPLFSFILAGVQDDEVGSASGALNALQQLGSAVGVAVLGTIFFSVLAGGGFAAATERVLWVQAGLVAACGVLALLLPRHPRADEAVH